MSVVIDTASKYYPYKKVQEGVFNFKQYAEFPKLLCDYLIDAPKGSYTPPDDNDYPRCRLWKLLFHDGAKPLNQPLPTIAEKMSVLFDPEHPTAPPTEKGYRLIPQEYIKQAQEDAQTRIFVYMGRTIASSSDTIYSASVVFDIFTHYTYELNTQSDLYSRTGAIAAAIVEALNGVNMTGVGTFSMNKRCHPDCSVKPIFDGKTNVGQEVIIGLEMASIEPISQTETVNMPFMTESGNIRLA